MGDRCGLTDALSPARPQEKRHARLAEAGNTAHELMAISVDAHRMSAMVKMRERTKSADHYTNIGSALHKHGKKAKESNG